MRTAAARAKSGAQLRLVATNPGPAGQGGKVRKERNKPSGGGLFAGLRGKFKKRASSAASSSSSAKPTKKRIRWIDAPNKVVAQVEERRGLRWVPTGQREEVDLGVAAKAMAIYDQRNGNTAGDDTAGFGDRLKRFAKRVAKSKVGKVVIKAHTAPLKAIHKITHHKNSPIRKAEMALQKYVGKALPFTRPFIKVHNKLSGGVHDVVKAAGDNKSIKKALKKGGKKVKPSAKDLNTLADAASSAAGGAAAGGKLLPAGVTNAAKAAAAAAKPTGKELAELAEERRKVLANGIATALKKVPAGEREAVRKELIRQSTSWAVVSPKTGIKYQFQL